MSPSFSFAFFRISADLEHATKSPPAIHSVTIEFPSLNVINDGLFHEFKMSGGIARAISGL